MSFASGNPSSEAVQTFLEVLQNDFRTLANETKKKYPQIKESCEEAIIKLKVATSTPSTQLYYVVNQILYALVQGCESKDVKIIKYCLGMMQRLITQQVVDQKGARYITDTLWMLMEHGSEEVKVLQTVTLLLTTNSIVHGETLAKALVLCFRLHFTKDSTTINTAGATVRQLVSLVFERVIIEDQECDATNPDDSNVQEINIEELKQAPGQAPKCLKICAADAFLLFQDLVQLVNADQPYYLLGMTEMTRTFGLELLETVLTTFPSVFYKHQEFSFLLKERVCALVIKLFSPNIKYRTVIQTNSQQPVTHDKPYFPISMRLLRVVSILIQKYHRLLVTECEIFLSLIVKFLDPDKPSWQRSLALEVIHRMTVQPELLVSFCQCYDLKDHATNIFQDIINSLGAYVQSLFASSHPSNMNVANSSQQSPLMNNLPMTATGTTQQAGFLFRSVWFPLVVTFPTGQSKSTYLEMLDKVEPPAVLDGFGISVAYACLLDIVRSVSLAVLGPTKIADEKPNVPYKNNVSESDRQLHTQLISSSWCGLLAALTPLIDAATDESITENVLKAMQNYASLCGTLDMQTPRDAFITAICRSSLPPHYALSVLNMGYQFSGIITHTRTPSQDLNHQYITSAYGDTDFRHQVVAVGTPLPTSSVPIGAQQGPVMLTLKNLQSMRCLIQVAHCHGSVLASSWHIVLCTLQHLVFILGLKPSTGGSFIPKSLSTDATAGITTSVMAELPVLSQMLSQLFESSQYLDDVALHHLIDALCKLSQEAMELAYSNREPSLFAVAKLLETGLVNLSRIEVLWRPLTNHLLEVCQHPHLRMREWGVEAITYLVKQALQFKYETPLKDNLTLQTLLLNPLAELSTVPHADVRQRQLESVLQILNGMNPEILSHGWPIILGIIGAVNDRHGEALIRIAFQCLQLVVTDFLPVLQFFCLALCVNTAAKFGTIEIELNISLTAIGLMWNISDYFNQNQDKLSATVSEDQTVLPDFPGTLNIPNFDKLWACLFARLSDLCVDHRPAVRKSAGQTLFSTISAHGNLLNPPTWQIVLWQILFPLLDKVRTLSSSASSEKVDTTGNILIHHSRNTAQKQWAETQVLTLSGVARVFNTKRHMLQNLGDFNRAWSLLLEFIENAALSKSNEVSLAALKSFQEIIYNKPSNDRDEDTLGQLTANNINQINIDENADIWNIAWRVWLTIGTESTKLPTASGISGDKNDVDIFIPSQAYLTALIQIFPALFQHIKHKFTESDLQQLCRVSMNAVTVPVHSDSTPYIMSSISDSLLTPLHDGALDCIDILCKEVLSPASPLKSLISIIFNQLLSFSKFACVPPIFDRLETRPYKSVQRNSHQHNQNSSTIEWVSMNYIPFGEKALNAAVKIYLEIASDPIVIEKNILCDIIHALKIPLAMKYKCMASSTWKLAITSLLQVLQIGLPVARQHPESFTNVWPALSDTLDKFLFPAAACTIEDRGIDEMVLDEAIDCQVIEMLRDEILPYADQTPHYFILDIVTILNKGSIHSATIRNSLYDAELKLREEFAKTCFETLLQFSLLSDLSESNENKEASAINNNNTTNSNENGISGGVGHLAIATLLKRFEEVVRKFTEDEKQSAKNVLPKYRLSEISFVIKAIATLIASMKKTSTAKVDKVTWDHLIALFPLLVDCTTTSSVEVSRSLREALIQYGDLLRPPPTSNHNEMNGVITES